MNPGVDRLFLCQALENIHNIYYLRRGTRYFVVIRELVRCIRDSDDSGVLERYAMLPSEIKKVVKELIDFYYGSEFI